MIKILLFKRAFILPFLLGLLQSVKSQPVLAFPVEVPSKEVSAFYLGPLEGENSPPAAASFETVRWHKQSIIAPYTQFITPFVLGFGNSSFKGMEVPLPVSQTPLAIIKNRPSFLPEVELVNPYQDWDQTRLRFKILIVLITAFVGLTIIMLVAVLASRFYKLAIQDKTERLKKRYELLLMHVLFFEEDRTSSDWEKDKIIQHFKKHYLKSTFKRRILIGEILDLNKNFTGQFAENLRLLFIYLGLEKDSFALLHNSQWNLKAQGVCELAQMLIYDAAPNIKELINHPNDLVRMESHVALVKLEKERGLAFLHQLHRSFTHWQQLNLQYALSKFDRDDIPDFSQFLGAANLEVMEFSIKMIGIYNQVDALPAVENLLKHPAERIRLTAIETIKVLDAAPAVPALLFHFPSDTKGNKVAILTALASLGGAPSKFFEEQLMSGDHDLSLVAARALHDLQKLDTIKVQVDQSPNVQLQKIIKHALDCRN